MDVGGVEFLFSLMLALTWAAPIAAAVWVIHTLHRMRQTQARILERLAAIETAMLRRS